ncbi:MAG: DUF1295 domain-containing protein [Microthrixaceae bacterium]|nr:DUF1295 domain-containing protein [Microthrixaceae bacterium]
MGDKGSSGAVRIGPRRARSRRASFGVVAVAYALALVAGVVSGAVDDSSPYLAVAAGMFAGTVVIFVFSRAVNNTSMFDAYWSLAPPVVAVSLVIAAEPGVPGARQALVLAVVLLWAVRLTANWARGWPGLDHEDWRYVEMRTNGHPYWVQSFFGLHLVPTIEVYLGCLPLVPALARGTEPLGPLDGLAMLVGLAAVTVELVADEQLRRFNRTKAAGDICADGLWSWSRHPNYFGELCFWWSLFLFGVAAAPGYWWTVVGAISITVMFAAASIPMIERRSAERRPAWAEYARRTPVLVPRPPRRP